MRRLIPLTVLVALLPGCKVIDNIPDDKLAGYIQQGAEQAAKYGLKLAIQKSSDSGATILADAKIADDVIKNNILDPKNGVFGGATTDVVRGAVDTALQQLSSKLKPETIAAIQLAIDILATQITLPANPTDKLDDRTRKAVVGLFTGMQAGIEDVLNSQGTKELAPKQLSWPKGK